MPLSFKCCLMLLLLAGAAGCRPDKEVTPGTPVITLLTVYSPAAGQGEARVEVNNPGPPADSEYGLVWSENPDPTLASGARQLSAGLPPGIARLRFSGLTEGTTFYVRAYLRQGERYFYSNELVLEHRAPFVWRALSGVSWSDQAQVVRSVTLGKGVVVVRPVDAAETQVWYYRVAADSWQELPPLDLPASRFDPLVFKLNKFGQEAAFFGGGYQVNERVPGRYVYLKDFWQYHFFGGGAGEEYPDFPFTHPALAHFTLDNRTFVLENKSPRQVWMLLNGMSWHRKNKSPGAAGAHYVTFAAGPRGYAVAENQAQDGSPVQLYAYDPEGDTWTVRAQFPGPDRVNGLAFSLKGKGYYGLGQSRDQLQGLRDIWEYDPATDAWQQVAHYPGGGQVQLLANTLDDKAYLGLGFRVSRSAAGVEAYSPATDFWEFTP